VAAAIVQQRHASTYYNIQIQYHMSACLPSKKKIIIQRQPQQHPGLCKAGQPAVAAAILRAMQAISLTQSFVLPCALNINAQLQLCIFRCLHFIMRRRRLLQGRAAGGGVGDSA
jgi:hypothetical protein